MNPPGLAGLILASGDPERSGPSLSRAFQLVTFHRPQATTILGWGDHDNTVCAPRNLRLSGLTEHSSPEGHFGSLAWAPSSLVFGGSLPPASSPGSFQRREPWGSSCFPRGFLRSLGWAPHLPRPTLFLCREGVVALSRMPRDVRLTFSES